MATPPPGARGGALDGAAAIACRRCVRRTRRCCPSSTRNMTSAHGRYLARAGVRTGAAKFAAVAAFKAAGPENHRHRPARPVRITVRTAGAGHCAGCGFVQCVDLHKAGLLRLHVRLARWLRPALWCCGFDLPGASATPTAATRWLSAARQALDAVQERTGLSRFVVGGLCSAVSAGIGAGGRRARRRPDPARRTSARRGGFASR